MAAAYRCAPSSLCNRSSARSRSGNSWTGTPIGIREYAFGGYASQDRRQLVVPEVCEHLDPAVECCRNGGQLAEAVVRWNRLPQRRYGAIGVALCRSELSGQRQSSAAHGRRELGGNPCSLPRRQARRPAQERHVVSATRYRPSVITERRFNCCPRRRVSFASEAANSRSPCWAAHPAAVECNLACE